MGKKYISKSWLGHYGIAVRHIDDHIWFNSQE
jgi:hypothetical protein